LFQNPRRKIFSKCSLSLSPHVRYVDFSSLRSHPGTEGKSSLRSYPPPLNHLNFFLRASFLSPARRLLLPVARHAGERYRLSDFFFSTDCLAPGMIFSLRLISSLRRSRLEENPAAVLCIYLPQRVLFSNSLLPSGLLHRAGSTHLPCRARPLLASMARPPAWSPFCSLSPSELAPSPCFSASVARLARISLRAGFSLPSSPPFPATRSLVPTMRAPCSPSQAPWCPNSP
jgi:hypothetical protein